MSQLYICYAEIRRLYGRENYTQPSRFLTEIPAEFIEEIRSSRISQPLYRRGNNGQTKAEAETGLSPGKLVRHKKFGEGTVVNLEGQGAHARVQVNFVDVGPKWLICAYANLEGI